MIAAKAVCFGEALKPEFKEYARKIVENAQALAAELQARGVKLVSGGTDNHLMLIDLRDEECTGKDLEAVWTACTSPPIRTLFPARPAARS